MDFKEGNPALSQGLDNATAILSLICLVAMVLGAIGVAMAMHAHLEQRMDMLAILKAVGARSADLLRIFSVADVGPGPRGRTARRRCGCGRDGSVAGRLWQAVAVHTVLEFPWRSVAAGLGTGLLTTLLFLPAAAAGCARNQARAGVAKAGGAGTARVSANGLRAGGRADCNWGFRLLWCLHWVELRGHLSDSVKVGGWFALLFSIALVVLLVLAAVASAHAALCAESRKAAAAFVAATWAGESVPARESVGRGAGCAGHRRDVDSCGLPDAGRPAARSARDGLAQTAQRLSD